MRTAHPTQITTNYLRPDEPPERPPFDEPPPAGLLPRPPPDGLPVLLGQFGLLLPVLFCAIIKIPYVGLGKCHFVMT